jgi:thiamine biosynthesis lipoprotein
MPSSSRVRAVERARPLLGTYVSVRVGDLPEARAHRAIDAAFEEIALVHRRMSFHDPRSDVSRLNREALYRPVAVHALTFEVLRWSRQMGERSRGCFDITVAAQLVHWGLLPPPACSHPPDPQGSWRDIELRPSGTVRFHRPVWIDLGGIAKGYAVDRAVECLRAWGVRQGCVNAGGDLRTLGPGPERIRLWWRSPSKSALPILELENGSVASSSGRDGRRREPVGTGSFACVVADRCVIADALTKIVLAQGARSEDLLRRHAASAHLYRPGIGWRVLATPW